MRSSLENPINQLRKTKKRWVDNTNNSPLKWVNLGIKVKEDKLNDVMDIDKQNQMTLARANAQLWEERPINANDSLMRLPEEKISELFIKKNSDKIPEKLKKCFESWLRAHHQVICYFEEKQINFEVFLTFLVNEDQEIKKLLNNPLFVKAISESPDLRHDIEQLLGIDPTVADVFFSKKNLQILFSHKINEICRTSLSTAVAALELDNKVFEEFINTQIQELNTDFPIDQAFLILNQQFAILSDFLNVLIAYKETNSAEFKLYITFLIEEIKSAIPSKKITLTVIQMREILEMVKKEELELSHVMIVFEELKKSQVHSSRQLAKALHEVSYLAKLSKVIDQNAYEHLLRLSFSYHLKHESVFPIKEMIGFYCLPGVNVKNAEELFDSFIQVLKTLGPDVDDLVFKEIIEKTASVINDKAKDVPALIPLLSLMVNSAAQSKMELSRCNALIQKLVTLDTLSLSHWVKILSVFIDRKPEKNLKLLLDVAENLESKKICLSQLAELFTTPPYPDLKALTKALNGFVKDLKVFINTFDKDPKSARAPQKNKLGIIEKTTEQILEEQFDCFEVETAISTVNLIFEGRALESQDQYDLAQQITYINAIGREKPLALMVDNKLKSYNDLTKTSRLELRVLTNHLITVLREPNQENSKKLKAQLRLLAVLREQYFRTTGIFISPKQLLTVLVSIKNPNNILIEMGEDKQAVTAILAVMQWVEADGGTVDVCMANQNLAIYDYKECHVGDFFSSIGIASSLIEAGSQLISYKKGGINYSTIGDLTLFGMQGKINNEKPAEGKEVYAKHLIINTEDFSTIDENQVFHFYKNEIDDESPKINPLAWVYPLVIEFIRQEQFQNTDPKTRWDENQDIKELRDFLEGHAPSDADRINLNSFPDNALTLWINSAIEAQYLVEGVDFKIVPKKSTYTAIPLNQKALQINSFFSKGVQQFLEARLQIEYPSKHFLIEPEMEAGPSASIYDLLKEYKKGRIIGLSTTLDTHGLAEQCRMWDIKTTLKTSTNVEASTDKLERIKVIEKYYLQKTSELQHVVLNQFDEWKEMLHLIYPQSEWLKLDDELLIQKEDLNLSLVEQWDDCLKKADPQNKYPNPYERQDAQKNWHLKELDEALNAYEKVLCEIWKKHQVILKEKANLHIVTEDSIEGLRCRYLNRVSLEQQFKLNKIVANEKKQFLFAEKKKAKRFVTSGLDINGAMLRFCDSENEEYRTNFVNNQIKLFVEHILKCIKNNKYLSTTVRTLLIDQVSPIKNLNCLVDFLIEYAKKSLPKESYSEKYFIQPIISELLELHRQTKLQKTKELDELQNIYLNNVALEMVTYLETCLSWAARSKRGLGYLLERSAVKDAANALLDCVKQVKSANNLYSRQEAIRNLYKVLVLHEAKLEGLWLFSFGHKNTRTLIKQTLTTLNKLTVIDSGENELNADFIQDCRDEAIYQLMNEQLNLKTESLERNNKIALKKNDQWEDVVHGLIKIQRENTSIYAYNEMYYFLTKKLEELARTNSKLQTPVNQLRLEVSTLFAKYKQGQNLLLSSNKYFTHKAEKIKKQLKGLEGFEVKRVQLNKKQTGFAEVLDLIIEGSGAHALLSDFTHYQSNVCELITERKALKLKVDNAKDQLIVINRVFYEQLPLLQSKTSIDNIDQFPSQFQAQVGELSVFKKWLIQEKAEALPLLPLTIQESLHDRELIKTFMFPDLQVFEISKIHNLDLRKGLLQLQEKIVAANRPKSFFAQVVSVASSYISTREGIKEWRKEFEKIVESSKRKVHNDIQSEIDRRHALLTDELSKLQQKAMEQVKSLCDQVKFLDEKIHAEEDKSAIYVKQIADSTELFEFEESLAAVQEQQILEDSNIKSVFDEVDPKTDIECEKEPFISLF